MSSKLLELSFFMEDEFGLLLAAECKRNSIAASTPKFNLDLYNDDRCKTDFRFQKQDIIRLANLLKLPTWMTTSQRKTFRGVEGLCILLRRLAYPNRLADLQLIFGRSLTDLSAIINRMINFVYSNFQDRVTSLDQWWFEKDYLHIYSQAVTNKGCPLAGCIGFIDGTIQRTCRPIRNQRQVYSGHKRTHGLKYQSVVTQNGLIANLFGPIVGRRHDSYMLQKSGLLAKLGQIVGADALYLYGDSGYPYKPPHLITPFFGANLTPERQQFNEVMSKLRVCVEWEFGELFEQFAFLNYKYNQKIYMQPVGKYMIVATFFKNCLSCLYGCQTSVYFNLPPPTLEQYVNNVQ